MLNSDAGLPGRDTPIRPDGDAVEATPAGIPVARSAGSLVPPAAGTILLALCWLYPNAVPDCRSDQINDMFEYVKLSRIIAANVEYPTKHWMPGFPLLLAGLMKCFGTDWMALKMAMFAIACGAMLAAWRLFRAVVPVAAAGSLALVLASTPIVFDYTHRLMSEIPALLSSIVALLALVHVVRGDDRRGFWGWVIVLAVGSSVAVLVRGNALAIAPALVVGIFRCGKSSRRRQRLALVGALMAILGTFVAWTIRSERYQYDGIHNVTYLQEIQAQDIEALWRASGRFGEGVERVDARALASRVYGNLCWHQIYQIDALLIPAADRLAELKRPGVGLGLAALLLLPQIVGLPLLARRSPEALAFLLASMALILLYPTGGSSRMLLPTVPLLLLNGYLGLEGLLGLPATRGWLAAIMAANLAICAIEADKQRLQPYSREGFQDFLDLIVEDLPRERRPGEQVGSDLSVEVFALTGLAAQESEKALSAVARGEAGSALLACPSPRRFEPGLEAKPLARRGEVYLYRVTKGADLNPDPSGR